jgi:hypothetical protein
MTARQHEAAAERVLARASDADDITPAADRIEGAKAIAAFLGITERQARWRLDRGLIPHAREGERFVASKSALREHWRRQTSGGTAQTEAA